MGCLSWRETLSLRRSSRAKHVRIKIHPPGLVEVVVPHDFDRRELDGVIERHASWVEKHLEPYREQPLELPSLPAVLRLPAIEQQWRVAYRPQSGGRNLCRESGGGQLTVCADGVEPQRTVLKRWLSRAARSHLVPWLEQTSMELGLPYSGVTVRGQRTRWGSCSARGHINLNYALLFLEPDLVRYLFVHELCHTVHLNHSPRYWSLVASKEPRYRVMERALRQAAREVPGWLHGQLDTMAAKV